MSCKKPVKIALAHLKHTTAGRHASFMPVGIGYIGAYAREQLGSENVELRFYESPDLILQDIKEWRPHIIGLAHYCWNSNVNQLVFHHAKTVDPKIICVGGGPDVPHEDDECSTFLMDRPAIDFFATLEGEIAFAALAQKVLDGTPLKQLKSEPQLGLMSLHPATGGLIVGPPAERIFDMDVIPSPYLTGLMDQWFDGTYSPALETSRGCPYSCGFCEQGDPRWSRIARFSIERIRDELDFMAERMKDSPGILLAIHDANFGMYKEDEVIAEHIGSLQARYNWPLKFDLGTGKSQHERIIRVAEKVGNRLQISLTVQSLNEKTLDAVKRRNIPLDRFPIIKKAVNNGHMQTVSETIVPLPEETKESHFKTIKTLSDLGIERIFSYTPMLLKGTKLASKEFRSKYQMTSKFRLIPRQFGEYNGRKCFEIEEVCVATNTLDFDDYLECRGFSFVVFVFMEEQYDAVHRLLNEFDVPIFDWLFKVWQLVKDGDSGFSRLYMEFIKEANDELFSSEDELFEKFSVEENYVNLLHGKLGDNLIRKYRTKNFLEASIAAINVAFDALRRVIPADSAKKYDDAVSSVAAWMVATRDISKILHEIGGVIPADSLELSYDVDEWYSQKACENAGKLGEFKRPVYYDVLNSNQREIEDVFKDLKRSYPGDDFLATARLFTHWGPGFLWRSCEKNSSVAV